MLRRDFVILLLAGCGLGAKRSSLQALKWKLVRERHLYHNTTVGNPKWENGGHRAGCILYAPDNICICDELLKDYERRYGKIKRQPRPGELEC